MELTIFCQKTEHGCVFICFVVVLFVCFFPPGVIVSTTRFVGLFVLFVFFPRGDRFDQAVLKCRERAHSNVSIVPFLSDQKIGGHLGPLPHSFFGHLKRALYLR